MSEGKSTKGRPITDKDIFSEEQSNEDFMREIDEIYNKMIKGDESNI